ncbi:hypothetical protein Tco_1482657 [Tanacetum coccineum]
MLKGTPKLNGTPESTPDDDCSQKGCSFRLWASWMQNEPTFQIKTLIHNHTYARNFDMGTLVTCKWIAKQFATKIIKNPRISYRQMKSDVREKFLLNVSIGQCKGAKQRAVYDHEGGLIDHYGKLWYYREQRFAINLGDLLTAMRRDANNQMFPMAWAVGLKEAVRDFLPHVDHRMCARHIYATSKEIRQKDTKRVLEQAKKMGVYRKRGSNGWRGLSQRIQNQKRRLTEAMCWNWSNPVRVEKDEDMI